ncbi:MAG: hypothetical protein L6R40_006014 [Gallowayella cf. fulva]|nr:MAG: hypothetical protein L6R40_006014 [Xanthomendoza cf. fulva]
MLLLPRSLLSLATFIHLSSYLCTCQTIGTLINNRNPQWHCNVDSFEYTRGALNDCAKAYDGDDRTFWHSKWRPSGDPLPHHITIDLGKVYNTRSMTYLPRQDRSRNGNIGQWRISLSPDNSEFRLLNGTWSDNSSRKTVDFLFATAARYVRLDALTEAGGRGPWSSAAQIDIYEEKDSSSGFKNDSWSSSSGTTNQRPYNNTGSDYATNTTPTQTDVAIVDGETVTLRPKPTTRPGAPGTTGPGYRNSTVTMSNNATGSSGGGATGSGVLPTSTGSAAGTGTGAPGIVGSDSSAAVLGRVVDLRVGIVGVAAAVGMVVVLL